jgi:hypothetical protein
MGAHFLTSAIDGGERWASRPGRYSPGRRVHGVQLNRRLGGLQSWTGWHGEEIGLLHYWESNPRNRQSLWPNVPADIRTELLPNASTQCCHQLQRLFLLTLKQLELTVPAIHHRNNLSNFMLRNVWFNLFMNCNLYCCPYRNLLPWCIANCGRWGTCHINKYSTYFQMFAFWRLLLQLIVLREDVKVRP